MADAAFDPADIGRQATAFPADLQAEIDRRRGESRPVPGIAHGSIPGILGYRAAAEMPSAPEPVAPNFDLTAPAAAKSSGLPTGMSAPLPPAQGFDSAIPPAQGFGNETHRFTPAPPMPPAIDLPPGPAFGGSATPPPLPPAAVPHPATAAAAAAAPPRADTSIIPPDSLIGRMLTGLNNFRDQNRLTLLAMAGGLAGAPSIGTGISRAFTAAVPAQQFDIAQHNQNMTARALVAKGLDPKIAEAAATNPEILKELIPRLFGAKQWQVTETTDAFGQKRPILYDPVTGATKRLDLSGSQGAAPAGAPAVSSPGSAGVRMSMDNFDMSRVDPNLRGWDYVKQYPQEVEAAVRDYMSGGVMPTGNPRNNGIATMAKTVAQKVAMDLGEPGLADDTNYPARRQMATDLSRGQPGSLGGQITFGGTSLGHLADVAEKAVSLGNVNGFGVAPVARWTNWARGLTTDQAQKVNDVQGAIQHYGQEITKFYTGSPGGEAERMRFLNTIDTSKSAKEIAGAIRAERDLIPDRLNQIKSQIADRLGQHEADKQLSRVNLNEVVGRINASLAKLDPDGPEAKMMGAAGAPAGPAPAAPAPPKSGEVRDGYRFKGGNPADPHNWEPVK